MLFKISVSNLKKSFKDYAIYFLTLILGVSIFYVFNAIESQTAMMNISTSQKEIIELMNNMLSGVSVFVSLVLGFLIIYASQFLIKRRNKEFAIYLTLGMSKRKISTILFVETLLIGIISLAVGLGIGSVLSQLMSLVVVNMFRADMTRFAFTFSASAMIKTCIFFGIIYFMVMVFNTWQVQKCKLIDLLQSSKKSETIKLKNPWLCVVVFIVSVIALGYAYYKVTIGMRSLQEAMDVMVPIIIGIVTTFTIFWSLSGLMLTITKSMKSYYYKGLNSFTLRQISSKINTATFMLTSICLMLFVTICVLSSAVSMKNSLNQTLSLAPKDFEVIKQVDLSNAYYDDKKVEESQIPVEETLKNIGFDPDEYLADYLVFEVYGSSEFTLWNSLGNSYDEIKSQFQFIDFDSPEEIIKVSDYNRIAKINGLEPYELNEDEYVLVADFNSMANIRNRELIKDGTITISGTTLHPKFDQCQPGYIYMGNSHTNAGIFVVPDSIELSSNRLYEVLIGDYVANDKEGKKEIENILINIEGTAYLSNTKLNVVTKISLHESSTGLGAIVTFIGLYIGLIFLIACAALLALKELSESTDNKDRYNMLRKLGADEKLIHQTLFRQIAFFFVFPLVFAAIHAIFGIQFCTGVLELFGKEEMLNSVTTVSLFVVGIYSLYFIVTYLYSKNIISEK